MSQPVAMKKPAMPQLVNTHKAAEILGRSAATLKRWRAEGVGPNWIELQGRVSYDVNVLLEYIQKNTRVASVRAAMEETREAVLSCLSWKWRKRSSVKIAERTYEKGTKALHRRGEGGHSEAAPIGQGSGLGLV